MNTGIFAGQKWVKASLASRKALSALTIVGLFLTVGAPAGVAFAHGVGASLNFSGTPASASSIQLSWTSTSATTGSGSTSLGQHDLDIWYCSGACTPTSASTLVFAQHNNFLPIYSGSFTHTGLAAGTYNYFIREKHGGDVSATLVNTITVVIPPPPTTGVLKVVKNVVLTGGGTAVPATFNLSVKSGGVDVAGSPAAGSVTGTNYTLAAGSYTVSEPANAHYTADLSACGTSGTVTVTSGATTTCTVTNTFHNAAPVAADGVLSTDEDVAGSGSVSATDSDLDTVLYAVVTGPLHGLLAFLNGAFTYTPFANFNGSDSFTFSAFDGVATDEGAVAITVNSINDLPVANDDVASTDEETPVTVTGATLLSNDTDVEGPLSISAVDTASANGGTIVDNTDGTYTYTPAVDFAGSDTFTYTITDGTASDVGTVTVTVSNTNDAPVAVADTVATSNSFSTDEDVVLNTPVSGVLVNDTDADGNPLTAVLDDNASNGVVVLNGDGSFTYTPNANFNGTDSFTYHVTDGSADSSVVSVTITVAPVNDAPVAADQTLSTDQNTATSSILLATDVDGDTLTYTFASPVNGSFSVSDTGTGAFTYVPALNYTGVDTFHFSVSDGSLSDSGDVTINVAQLFENTPALCSDDIDNDNDQAIDAQDSDCEGQIDTIAPVSHFDVSHSHEVIATELVALSLTGASTDVTADDEDFESGVASGIMQVYLVGSEEFARSEGFATSDTINCGSLGDATPIATVDLTLATPNTLSSTWTGAWTPTAAGAYCFQAHATDVAGNLEHTASAGPIAIIPPVPVTPPAPPSGGGGGGGGNGNPSIFGQINGAPAGQVLGASTFGASCERYLTQFVGLNRKNDSEQVSRLQHVLGTLEGLVVGETGVYDTKTNQAVHAFQTKYASDILTPWGINNSTGFVYLTTRKKVNEVYCKALGVQFPLTSEEQSIVDNYKKNGGRGQGSSTSAPAATTNSAAPAASTGSDNSDTSSTDAAPTADSQVGAAAAVTTEGSKPGFWGKVKGFLGF